MAQYPEAAGLLARWCQIRSFELERAAAPDCSQLAHAPPSALEAADDGRRTVKFEAAARGPYEGRGNRWAPELFFSKMDTGAVSCRDAQRDREHGQINLLAGDTQYRVRTVNKWERPGRAIQEKRVAGRHQPPATLHFQSERPPPR